MSSVAGQPGAEVKLSISAMPLFVSRMLMLTTVLVCSGTAESLCAGASIQASAADLQIPADLRSYVERFTGPEPIDCGRHILVAPFAPGGQQELRGSTACVSNAAKDSKPAWTIKQEQGIDSAVFQGLLGTGEGAIFRFSYDSAPCGGPGCAGRFSIERCESPAIVTNPGGATRFGCVR